MESKRRRIKRGDPLSHRVALMLLTGIEPDGLVAAHGPRHNRACVNPHPEHGMQWATHSENNLDKTRDGTDHRGERCGTSKLSNLKVIAIRSDERLNSVIAIDYGVSHSTICDVKARRTWAWLP